MDLDRIRAETPGTHRGVHLLAAGSSLPSEAVLHAISEYLELEAAVGGYDAARIRHDMLDSVYEDVAALVGAKRREIAIVENATVAWSHAFYALPLRAGHRILTSRSEYAANYVAYLQRAKRDRVEIEVIPNRPTGEVDVDALEAMIDERVGVISVSWIPTNGGLVNPAAAIGEVARRHGIPYLLDACQAVGQMPVNVTELGCDFLSETGRKFLRGQRGTGFLYVAERWLASLEPVMLDHFGAPWVARDRYVLRDDARRFETWESSFALRAGLGAAARYARDLGLEAIRERAWSLAEELRERLRALPGATLCDLGSERCAIVSFTLEGHDPATTVKRLRDEGIFIGVSSPENTRLDSEARSLPDLFRAAPHYYNTSHELERLVAALGA
ncbi:MAG: aminotransferase class V-fold PLP-dependent enzyme [Myxococcota bacterium]